MSNVGWFFVFFLGAVALKILGALAVVALDDKHRKTDGRAKAQQARTRAAYKTAYRECADAEDACANAWKNTSHKTATEKARELEEAMADLDASRRRLAEMNENAFRSMETTRLSSTGIDFGGWNPSREANPLTTFAVESSMPDPIPFDPAPSYDPPSCDFGGGCDFGGFGF